MSDDPEEDAMVAYFEWKGRARRVAALFMTAGIQVPRSVAACITPSPSDAGRPVLFGTAETPSPSGARPLHGEGDVVRPP